MNTPVPHFFKDWLKNIPGLNSEALITALNSSPASGLRLNLRKISREEGKLLYDGMDSVKWCDSGFTLPRRPVFTLNPLLHAGLFYVQDPSSMIYEQIISVLRSKINAPSVHLLDFCAAPGGKTTAIINSLKDDDIVVANEYVASRGKILRENLAKWGFPNIITTGDDSAAFRKIGPAFDIIAIDAPCSGEGMMRKDETARSQWSPNLVENCARLQKEILSDIVNALRPGGFLIYSTCTFNTLENEDNSLFISEECGLTPISPDSMNLTGISEVGRALKPRVEALRFMPHLTPQGEGLYVSIFQKPEDSAHSDEKLNPDHSVKNTRKPKVSKGLKIRSVPKDNLVFLSELIQTQRGVSFEISDAGRIHALSGPLTNLRDKISAAGIRLTSAGTPVGELKGKDIIPDSRLVLSSIYKSGALQSMDVDEEIALRYLRRESFPLRENISKGYVVITYKGNPLGLMKNIGSRANNLYPSAWKINI